MKRIFTSILLSILILNCVFAQKLTRSQYIEKYKNIAIRQMQTYGIPASIILAQGCLESGNGNSSLARDGKNHFGIKCAGWQGRKVYHDDDEKNECFRAYSTDEESFVDHSDFLRYRKRYAFLFDLKPTDYKAWAKGLKKAGYATAPHYAESLIDIIEEYQLYKYDKGNASYVATTAKSTKAEKQATEAIVPVKPSTEKIAPVKKPSEAMREYDVQDNFVVTINRAVNKRNKVKYTVAKYNDTYERIGDEFKIAASQLRHYNDAEKDSQLQEGEIVYLEMKKAKAGKDFPMHVAESGETMRDIAQQYGVRLRDLCKKNAIKRNETLRDGQVIYLIHEMKK